MKRWFSVLVTILLAACATRTTPTEKPIPSTDSTPAAATVSPAAETPAAAAAYPDLGPAPELSGEVWLNTPTPLRLSDLRGQVVLIDMWTFG